MKLFITVYLVLFSFSATADLANDLLKSSDQGRGGIKEGLTWKIKLETTEEGEKTSRDFLVKAKEHDALVEALAPARNKGEVFLFNDRNMWFFKPSLKKPVAISSRQKLTGQAANGDIASTHYARDYDATLEKTVDIKGEKFHILLLKAKAENLTYDQIRYWISDKTKLAMKAEFLTLQGNTFKIGKFAYKNTLQLGGKKYPFVSQMMIIDAKFNNNFSLIKYGEPKIENHSESLFNVNRLSR